MRTSTDPTGRAILTRMLCEADQMLAEWNEAIADEKRND
jgi:hypothetical protein